MIALASKVPAQGIDINQGVYKTDPLFMSVVNKEYRVVFDLAADSGNAQADGYFTEKDDALSDSWSWAGITKETDGGFLWLNPPYDDIGAWARRCAVEAAEGAKILFLVPASVGSNWYRKYVEDFALVHLLNGRLTFDFTYPLDYVDRKTAKENIELLKLELPTKVSPKAGQKNTDPYPKDMLLAVFDDSIPLEERLARTWKWDTYL